MSKNDKKKQPVKEDKIDPVENKRSTEPVKENKKSSGEKLNKKKPVETISSEIEKLKKDTAFNWEELESTVSKDSSGSYSEKEREKLEKMYAGTLNEISEKEVVKGTIVSVTDRNVILSIGFKSDGLVSISEFRDIPDIKSGDEVDIFIENQEDQNGQLLLSRNKAKIVMGWDKIRDCLKNDKVIDGFVKRRTKGGLIIDIFAIEAFLPGSQIDIKPVRDYDIYVNKKIQVKIIKINYANDNVVVSHKVLVEKDIQEQRTVILNNLEKGQVLEGTVKNITNFGAFIDLGGVDGLLHVTDISWARINHPEEVVKLDQKINVVVLDFDQDKTRISLGMKQLEDDPWESISKDMEVGSKVKGKIVNIADYGIFLEIVPGVEGLIHVSEISWSLYTKNPKDDMKVGDELEAMVLSIDKEDKKISLGLKQLTEDPWKKQDFLTKYAIETKHKGVIRNLTNFGLFVELEDGIDGMLHVSDLSWTKKIKHPSEFVKVGEKLEIVVLEVDVENRKLALGHKQLEENPWDTFETVFDVGSVHRCTIISKDDKSATLELPYGIRGTALKKHIIKEDGSFASVSETLDFKVIEFSKKEKRILLSHTKVLTEKEDEQLKKETKKKKTGKKPKKAKSKKPMSATSKLGEIEALSGLQEKLGDTTQTTVEKKKSTVTKTTTKTKAKTKEAKAEADKTSSKTTKKAKEAAKKSKQ
ncbi:MAG: 30S ribosomal protein S1 [Cytophagales bacterium]|nr:30S ribosomal protein S1 [Cytophagales bacterium]